MYRQVLMALDGSEASELALKEALRLAAEGALVRLVTVAQHRSHWHGLSESVNPLDQARLMLEMTQDRLRCQGVVAEAVLVDMTEKPDGDVVQEILAEVQEWPADVLVVGSHGRRGWQRVMMGSVAEGLVRRARCPVLVVPWSARAVFECLSAPEVYGMWEGRGAPSGV